MENQSDRKETLPDLLDAALNALEEGIVVLDEAAHVVAWNPSAGSITGYQRAGMLGRELPESFYEPDAHAAALFEAGSLPAVERHLPVKVRHALGHALPAMLRQTALRDALGRRSGTLLRFHPTEDVDALPHGATEDDLLEHQVEHTQAEIEERLDEAWQEWLTGGVPFGVLWITVDQAEMLRKTHGRDASEAMLSIVERTLSHALRPAEILGRWGSHEFLVLSHERTPQMLQLHARHVAELARSADFRWWGDRVDLTVSIGAAQAGLAQASSALASPAPSAEKQRLSALLLRAQHGMQAARIAGGNTVVLQPIDEIPAESGGNACSRS